MNSARLTVHNIGLPERRHDQERPAQQTCPPRRDERGFQESTLVEDFPNLGEVWFNPDFIANILSLSYVRKVCRVTMDTADESSMIVHRLDGAQMKFREHTCGLYMFSTPAHDAPAAVPTCTMLSTVRNQKKLFTPLRRLQSRRGVQIVPAPRSFQRN